MTSPSVATRATSPLSNWRVEWLRLVRTRRLLVLGCLYLFLGATGPLLAKYAQQIFAQVSSSSTVSITVAKPTPADGILGFYKSAMQLGLVACIVVTGLAVCVDSRAPLSVYYRTRSTVPAIVLPRLVVATIASCATYTLGFLFGYYETVALLGAPAFGATAQTWALGLAYTAFAVALTFVTSALFRGTLGAVGTAIGLVILLPIIGNVRAVSRWLPSRLTTLPTDIFARDAHQSSVPSLLVCAAFAVVGSAVAMLALLRRQVA